MTIEKDKKRSGASLQILVNSSLWQAIVAMETSGIVTLRTGRGDDQ